MRVPRYEMVDHTADLGITLRASDLPGLFEGAALALFDLLTDINRVGPCEERRIEISGIDREDLLVLWLGELLSLHDAEGYVFSRFRIETLTEDRLVAAAWGELFDPDRHAVKREMKAVTHHDARVMEDSEGWFARVIFDV